MDRKDWEQGAAASRRGVCRYGSAFEVYRELGAGFLEAVYQEAIERELRKRAIPFEARKELGVWYREDERKKFYIADLLCYSLVVSELKAIDALSRDDAQLLNRLRARRLRVGVLINFGRPGGVEWRRKVL